MTAALSSTQSTSGIGGLFASLTKRVKPIDEQELVGVAQAIVAQQAGLSEGTTQGLATAQGVAGATYSTQGPFDANGNVVAESAEEAAGLAQAEAAVKARLAQQQAAAAAPQAQAQAPTTAQAQTQQGAGAAAATGVAAATGAIATAASNATTTAVKIPSSNIAPRTQHDYWTKHIAQFAGKYLPDGPSMRPNCGPASVTMALRMIGLDVPGFKGQNASSVLDTARVLATGKNDTSVGTTDSELENLITKSGARWSESTNFSEVTGWIKQGIPVVLSGNPAYGWNHRYTKDQVYPFNGGHWVTVSGYDEKTGHYIVNDPLSQVGPIYVSEAELRSYNQAHGSLGIAVFR